MPVSLHFVEMCVLPLGLQVAGFVNGDAQTFATAAAITALFSAPDFIPH